jgi:hypothetical protein
MMATFRRNSPLPFFLHQAISWASHFLSTNSCDRTKSRTKVQTQDTHWSLNSIMRNPPFEWHSLR